MFLGPQVVPLIISTFEVTSAPRCLQDFAFRVTESFAVMIWPLFVFALQESTGLILPRDTCADLGVPKKKGAAIHADICRYLPAWGWHCRSRHCKLLNRFLSL